MTKLLKYSLFALALTLGTTTLAHAREDHRGHGDPSGKKGNCDNTAPEVDPSMAIGALTMLGGTLAVVRSRRRS